MDTQELNKVIATELGMKPRIMQEREYHKLYEDGFGVTGWVQVYDADELMFEYTLEWSTDLNAAVRLLKDLNWELKAHAPAMYTCDIWEAGYLMGHEMGHTPAEAICLTWLAYREKARGTGEK